jgi:Uridine phosphorylase
MMFFKILQTKNLPRRVILTDNPMRAKMLWAHHLENATTVYEQGENLVYAGSYQDTPIMIISTDCNTVPNVLEIINATEVIYLSECRTGRYPSGTIILSQSDRHSLLAHARAVAGMYEIPVITDAVTSKLYEDTQKHQFELLYLLTVSEETDTQSRFYPAARLAFGIFERN